MSKFSKGMKKPKASTGAKKARGTGGRDMPGKWIEGGMVVCGYKEGRPASLCESDVNSVYKYLDGIYRLRKSLGK